MERIASRSDPRIADFVDIREGELVRARGVFIAEGTVVVRNLVLRSHFPVRSILIAERHVGPFAAELEQAEAKRIPVYVASQEVLSSIAGFDLHRGCLAAGERGVELGAEELLAATGGAGDVVVLEALADHENVGAMFRNAAAFGARAVLLDRRCADPLYRKAIRVSAGTALTLPFARFDGAAEVVALLERSGFETWAFTPSADAEDLARLRRPERAALMFGTEGTGLSEEAQRAARRRVRIAMAEGVDSVNVATAGAIALFALTVLDRR